MIGLTELDGHSVKWIEVGELFRCNRGDHSLALLQRRLFQFGELSKLLQDVFHNASSLIDVSHFTAAENHGNLDFIFVLEEADCLSDFGADIVLAGFGAESNFFGFGLVGTLPGLFAFFVFVLAEVHDAANGWLFVGCNLDQIQTGITSAVERLVGGDDSVLSAIGTDYADRRNTDLIVDPRLNAFDCWDPFDLNK